MTTKPSLADALPLPAALRASGLPVSISTAARWCRAGVVPAIRVGSRWFARPDALRAAAAREVGNGV